MRTVRMVALILVTSGLWGTRVFADEIVTLTTVYQGVNAFDFKALRSTINKQPKWDGEGLPSLSLDNAVKNAKKSLDGSEKKLMMVELSRIVDPKRITEDTKWYYKITFSSNQRKFPEDVVVLFDGTVILPERATRGN